MSLPKKEMVQAMFNQIAGAYDRLNRILSWGQDQRWRRRLIRHVPLQSHLSLLDIATGTGDQIFALLKTPTPFYQAIGIDMAAAMLAIARKKNQNTRRISFLEADATALPFPKAHFDVVTCSFGIRNIENPSLALDETLRVLKPGGRVLILEFAPPPAYLRWLILPYLRLILPKVGAWLSPSKTAYRYLNQSIESFLPVTSFKELMRLKGFQKVYHRSYFPSFVTLYVGDKSASLL
jgi:demethylmenaquinone methyltransferase/2-methoxy-6-polyprenyl-1,4-benzoquinol methylase